MDHVPDEDQPRDEPATPAPRPDERPLHERITSPLSPAIMRLEKSREWRVVHRWRAHSTRIAAPLAARLAAVLLIVVALSGLLAYGWLALGLPTPLKPTISHAHATHATPSPAPLLSRILSAELTVALNAAMGCADGAPPPSAQAIYASRNFQTGGPPPNEIALTFDDGPTPSTSPPILDYLERTHTPATFFVIGQEARAWPSLVYREWRDGFAIGVHTWDHPSMPLVPNSQMPHQFGDTLAAIHAALGKNACIWLWRPPYGDYNSRVIGSAQRYGLTTIMWSDDPRDWSQPGVKTIAATALAEAQPGGIILMHDGPAQREQTAAALPLILAGLRARGLTPVTLPRLLADCHYPGVHITPSHQHTSGSPPSAWSSPARPSLSLPAAPDVLAPTLATCDRGE